MSYPDYASPQQYTDIAAHPGFKLKIWSCGDTANARVYPVIAWRLYSNPDNPVSVIAVTPTGITVFTPAMRNRYDENYALIMPGEEP